MAAALLVFWTAGCASPRPPRPPSLNLPEVAKDLTADRTGGQVLLRWTTPEKNTDRLEVKQPIVAEVCRIRYPPRSAAAASGRPAAAPPACTPVVRLTVAPGASQASETLPQDLLSGPAALLGYRVQLLNRHGRSAGLSPIAFAAAGAAPEPVEALRAKAVPEGAELEWQRRKTSAAVEIERSLLASAGARPPVRRSSGSSRPAPANSAKTPQAVASAPAKPPEGKVRLTIPAQRIEQSTEQSTELGGMIDSTAARGATYRYTAQRVLSVVIEGHALTVRSLPSDPVTVVLLDIFPPAVPAGLAAVPGGVDSSAESMDLSWTPDTDSDLAGYFVYRQEVSSAGSLTGAAVRLNATPVIGPAYQDRTAVRGQRYAYRVTAVDTSGNESAPSGDVQERIREP